MFRPALFASAFALALGALAPSFAHAEGGDPDGMLSVLPSNAKPGVCYARVKAPARVSPPTPGHGHWILSPPPPGAPGPLWCLVIEPGAPAQVIAPEHFGWIRVLCDGDQTPVRISGIQRRLHEAGVYSGAVSGHYDDATAAAVARYQESRHIDHGGYLSMTTVESIESAQAYVGASTAPDLAWEHSYHAQTIAPGPGCCAQPHVPPPPPPVVTIPVQLPPVVQPCCAAPPPPQPCCVAPGGWPGPAYPPQGYGAPAYGGGGLNWPGKVG